jgi:2,4-dienoyl-CoA reductase-like NADH-dependent reductase (Old Yellow Enzyme family)
LAKRVRRQAGVAAAAVGFITFSREADQSVRLGRALVVWLAREFLRDFNTIRRPQGVA